MDMKLDEEVPNKGTTSRRNGSLVFRRIWCCSYFTREIYESDHLIARQEILIVCKKFTAWLSIIAHNFF
jgi:hypothetical protein